MQNRANHPVERLNAALKALEEKKEKGCSVIPPNPKLVSDDFHILHLFDVIKIPGNPVVQSIEVPLHDNNESGVPPTTTTTASSTSPPNSPPHTQIPSSHATDIEDVQEYMSVQSYVVC